MGGWVGGWVRRAVDFMQCIQFILPQEKVGKWVGEKSCLPH